MHGCVYVLYFANNDILKESNVCGVSRNETFLLLVILRNFTANILILLTAPDYALNYDTSSPVPIQFAIKLIGVHFYASFPKLSLLFMGRKNAIFVVEAKVGWQVKFI